MCERVKRFLKYDIIQKYRHNIHENIQYLRHRSRWIRRYNCFFSRVLTAVEFKFGKQLRLLKTYYVIDYWPSIMI